MSRNYKLAILRRIVRYSKNIVKLWEQPKIKYYANLGPKHQPVFIIGAPRTGSTILYQLLTNLFDILYIDNLIDFFHNNFFFGFWLSNKLFHQKAHNCFSSMHGNTLQYGLRAPSECGGFWYQWCPRNHHFINYDEITDKMVQEIRENIFSVINYFGKSLLFKNMNAGLRLRLIYKIAPNAKLIFVKREPLYTAQSLIQVREKVYGNIHTWWSLMPRNFLKLCELDPVEQVVKQIYYIEKQIVQDSKLFAKENVIIVNYQKFCSNYSYEIDKIKDFLDLNGENRKDSKNPEVYFSEKIKLEEKLINSIKKEIGRLDWYDYSN